MFLIEYHSLFRKDNHIILKSFVFSKKQYANSAKRVQKVAIRANKVHY